MPLPYITTIPVAGASLLGIEGQNGPVGSITCEIDVPGQLPVSKTSTGAYSVVDCDASVPSS